MAEEIDDDVFAELDNIVESGNTESKSRKPRKASGKEQEKNTWIAQTVDETISDGYIYSCLLYTSDAADE